MNNKLLVTWIFACLTWIFAQRSNAQIAVTATLGSSVGNHTTLNAAFTAINNGVYQGDIVIKVYGNTNESASCVLNASGSGSASYTSLVVMPDDTVTVPKVISTSTANIVLIDVNAASYVLFEGRPMFTGTQRMLTFNNSVTTTTTNTTFRARNGSNTVWVRYCNIYNGAALTAGSVNVSIANTASSVSNRNIVLYNNDIKGGSYAVYANGTNATNYMKNIIISQNKISDFGLYAVYAGVNVSTLAIDSNTIFHSASFSSNSTVSSTRAINIPNTVDSGYYSITKNRIYGLKGAYTALYGIYIAPTTVTNVMPIFDVNNNSISLLEPNNAVNGGATGGLYGIFVSGATNPMDIAIIENTIRLGGTCVGGATTGSFVRSAGIMKFNSATSTYFTMYNNIVNNDRTGGNLVSGYSVHLGAWIYYNAVGNNAIDFNNYTGSPFIAGWGGTVYGAIAGYDAAATPNESMTVSKAVTYANTIDPYLSGTSIGDVDLIGAPISWVTTDIDYDIRDTLAPYKGADESTHFASNDLSSVIVYTFGRIPVGTTDVIRAVVKNTGIATVNNAVISLVIKGANNTVLTTTLGYLDPLNDTIVEFPAYTPMNLGFDTLYCIVPVDQNGTNDTAIWVRENTLNALSYSRPFMQQSGNVGNNGLGEIVAKFYTPVPNAVNQVNVNFTNVNFNGPFPFQIVLYADSGSNYGPSLNPIWVSATQQTINGVFNLSLPSIPVSGNFYIGVRQTSANNIGFAFQIENPIRNNTFYFRQGTTFSTTLAWNDFSVNPNNAFRFMIEPRLKINNDVGVTALVEPGGNTCAGGSSNVVKVQVENLGILDQTLSASNYLIVGGRVKRPGGSSFSFNPVLVTTGTIYADSTIDVTLSSNFPMDTVGVYSFTTWAHSVTDQNLSNDTMPTYGVEVFQTVAIPNVQKFDSVLTTPTGWLANRFAANAGSGYSSTNSMRVNLNNTAAYFANASLRSPKYSGITSNSKLRFDYKLTDATTGTALILNATDSIKIMVSTNCGASFTMAGLILGANHNPSLNYQLYQLNLAAYVGQSIMIRIDCDWFGTLNNAYLDIDNIRVINPVADAAIGALLSPCQASIIGQGASSPQVKVGNMGTSGLNNIPVLIQITGPATYNSTASILSLIAPNSASTLSFNPALNLTVAGNYTAKVFSAMLTDDDRFNDTMITSFVVSDINLGDSAVRAASLINTNYMTANGNGSLNIAGNAMTIEAWVYSQNVPGNMATGANILFKDSLQYGLMIDPNGYLKFNTNTTNGYASVTSSAGVPLVSWSHIAAEYNGTTMSIFVNGNLVASGPQTGNITPTTSPVTIGRMLNYTAGFTGYLDEIRVWNSALSLDQLRKNMHRRFANASQANLVGYWRLDEATPGAQYADASGNCNPLVIPSTAACTTINSDFPLSGNVLTSSAHVTQSGLVNFTGTKVSADFQSYSGSDSIYVHQFTGLPKGISPITSPGGITTVYPYYWVIYKFGAGTYTALDAFFNLGTGSFSNSAAYSDFNLFSRNATSNNNWNLLNNIANGVDFTTQKVDFLIPANMQGASQIVIGGNNQTLPIILHAFTGKVVRADAQLNWSTASEINNKGFEVERSFDGKNFEVIAWQKGAGNSNSLRSYTYSDAGVFTMHTQVWYRLRQVDLNGKSTLSSVVALTNRSIMTSNLQIAPNPFRDQIHILSPVAENASFEIIGMDGRTWMNQTVPTDHTIDASNLPSGVYILRVMQASEIQQIKLIKQ